MALGLNYYYDIIIQISDDFGHDIHMAKHTEEIYKKGNVCSHYSEGGFLSCAKRVVAAMVVERLNCSAPDTKYLWPASAYESKRACANASERCQVN